MSVLIQVFAENRGCGGNIFFLHALHFIRFTIILEEGQGRNTHFSQTSDKIPEETKEAGLLWLMVSKVLAHGHLVLLFLGTASWQETCVGHSGSPHHRQEAGGGTGGGQGKSCAHNVEFPPTQPHLLPARHSPNPMLSNSVSTHG